MKNSLFNRRGKEANTLISNFISLSLLQIAGYIFPLLTVPYLAHVIGVVKYGEIAFATTVMVYFQTLVDYGFIYSSVRDIARCRESAKDVSTIYTNVMWTRALLVLASFFLLIICIYLIPKFYEMRWVMYVSFLMIVGHAMFPDWMFQALEKMKYISIFNVLIKLLFTMCVFLFIHSPDDYLLQPLFTSLGFIISGIGSMALLRHWGFKISRPRMADVRKSLSINFDLFINQLVPNFYNSASVLLLGFFHGDAANGIYDAANRFNNVSNSFLSILSRTFYPFLSRRIDKHAFFRRINILFAMIVAFGLWILAPVIIDNFFPGNFDGAVVVLRILSVSIIFLALSNVYGTNFLILKGYERDLRKITLYSSILGLLIGIPLVYFCSYVGAAITVTISRGLIGILSMVKAKSVE